VNTLNTYKLKKDIKVITATKIFTAFDLFKALCIGADICNSARGMMLALGCVQSLKCNTNECPTGVATNNPKFVRGLVVSEKWQRVRNYHQHMLEDFLQLLAASGCDSLEEMNRSLIYRKLDKQWFSYDEVVKVR
jgi:glutamate synthase domain-containing protein 2